MQTVFRLVGYLKENEQQGMTIAFPPSKSADILAIVHAKVDDPDVNFGDWELTPEQAKQVGLLFGWSLDAELLHYDFFLEPQVFASELSEH